MQLFRFAPWVGMLAAALVSACSPRSDADVGVEDVNVRAVKLATVQAAHAAQAVDYAATIAARHTAAQGFRVGGKVLARPVEVGQRVARSQVLAELDARDLQLAAQASAAQVQAAAAQAELARSQWLRNQALHAEGFVSAAQLEHSASAHRSAAAQLEQARAQAAAQQRQSGYARLLAEGAGQVVAVGASAGQVVAAGQPVVTIALDGPRDAVFAVPERVRAHLRVGQTVQLRRFDETAKTAQTTQAPSVHTAHIRDIAASADAATRQFTVWASWDEDAGHGGESPALGSSWRVTLMLEASTQTGDKGLTSAQNDFKTSRPQKAFGDKNAPNTDKTQPNDVNAAENIAQSGPVTIAATALWQASDGSAQVWVFDAATSTVQPRRVDVAAARGDALVIASGLHEGERIVVAGTHVLSAGERVRPWEQR